MTVDLRTSWCARWAFERGLAAIYLVAYLVAVNQFVPLVGQHGLLPAARFVEQVPMRLSPSIFFWFPSDAAFLACAWLGVTMSLLALSGVPERLGAMPAAAVWASLYVLYLSFINVGQTFYSFAWESLLVCRGNDAEECEDSDDLNGLGRPETKGRSCCGCNGRIFALSEDGVTFVIQAGPEYRLLGKNSLDR